MSQNNCCATALISGRPPCPGCQTAGWWPTMPRWHHRQSGLHVAYRMFYTEKTKFHFECGRSYCNHPVDLYNRAICSAFSVESKVHGANMGPSWVLPPPDGPHLGLMNLAIRVNSFENAIIKTYNHIFQAPMSYDNWSPGLSLYPLTKFRYSFTFITSYKQWELSTESFTCWNFYRKHKGAFAFSINSSYFDCAVSH